MNITYTTCDVCASNLKLDGKVDVWSLGCLLYALIYGHTPFENEREGFMKLLAIAGDVRFRGGVTITDETRAIITSAVSGITPPQSPNSCP